MRKLIPFFFLIIFVLSGCISTQGYYQVKIGSRSLPFIIYFDGLAGKKLWYYDFNTQKVVENSETIDFEKNKPEYIDVESDFYSERPINLYESCLASYGGVSVSSPRFELINNENISPKQELLNAAAVEKTIIEINNEIETKINSINDNNKLTTAQKQEQCKNSYLSFDSEYNGLTISFEAVVVDASIEKYGYSIEAYKIRIFPVKNNKSLVPYDIVCPKNSISFEINKGTWLKVIGYVIYNYNEYSTISEEPTIKFIPFQIIEMYAKK